VGGAEVLVRAVASATPGFRPQWGSVQLGADATVPLPTRSLPRAEPRATYDKPMKTSSATRKRPAKKPITVRVPVTQLRSLMRARKLTSQSELINVLLDEEEERIRSWRALAETAGTMTDSDFDAALL
jgi:hypothetical protein